MNLEELLQEAKNGNMVAQYDLAMHYGKLLKETEDEEEIYRYSLDGMLWLKKSAQQGYGPAVEALRELDSRPDLAVAPAATPAESLRGEEWEIPEEKPAEKSREPIVIPPVPEKKAPALREEPEKIPSIIEEEPEEDAETVAAVAAAVREGTEKPSKAPAKDRTAPAAGATSAGSTPVRATREPAAPEEDRPRFFSSTSNAIVFGMLVVSLLLNVLLLLFLFRMTKEDRPLRSDPTPVPVAEVTPAPTAAPTARPTPGAGPTAAPTASPSAAPTPEPAPEAFWLDLSKYPKLEVKPDQSKLYDDYAYYVVTAEDYLNMRTGPDTKYERIREVPGLAKVGAVSKSGSWYLVSYEEDMGWVSGDYLTSNLNYQRPSRPSASATPAPSTSGNLNT